MKSREKGFVQGMCFAIAELMRMDQPTIAMDVYGGSGIKYTEIEEAEVDKYDKEEIDKMLEGEKE